MPVFHTLWCSCNVKHTLNYILIHAHRNIWVKKLNISSGTCSTHGIHFISSSECEWKCPVFWFLEFFVLFYQASLKIYILKSCRMFISNTCCQLVSTVLSLIFFFYKVALWQSNLLIFWAVSFHKLSFIKIIFCYSALFVAPQFKATPWWWWQSRTAHTTRGNAWYNTRGLKEHEKSWWKL